MKNNFFVGSPTNQANSNNATFTDNTNNLVNKSNIYMDGSDSMDLGSGRGHMEQSFHKQ